MVSFIICTVDPDRFARVGNSIAAAAGGRAHEVVAIRDAQGMAEGYNRGLSQSRGEHVVFCHDDIEFLSPHALDRVEARLSRFDVIGVAGTDRLESGRWSQAGHPHVFGQVAHAVGEDEGYLVECYGVPARVVGNIVALDGLFIAARRELAEKVRFDSNTFKAFHQYDIDFTFRAYLAGHQLAVCNDIHLLHRSRGSNEGGQYEADVARFDRKHAGNLQISPPRWFRTTVVQVRTRAEVQEVMGWPARHWID